MDTTNSTASTPTTQVAPPPPGRGSPVRLGILLLVLAVAIAALGYDYFVARPGSVAADEKLTKLNADHIAQSAKESERLTSEVIQRELGRAPTRRQVEDLYTVEYYCWWGKIPPFSTQRHFVTVLYQGDEPRRMQSHYLNGTPPEEDLPEMLNNSTAAEGDLEPAVDGATPPTPSAGAADGDGKAKGDGAKGDGKGKRKGKKGGSAAGSGTSPEDTAPGSEPAAPDAGTESPATDSSSPDASEASPTEPTTPNPGSN